ncbi:hypothetical protein [Streptomyces shenzhenensis]|uniref:hypothetical protein n=1 Tax=Streptomyces shenzhenensis TaxID=943815 RepID=UPI0015F02F84|nr:hypothetical protein [Streptomyces shenzhenensis]
MRSILGDGARVGDSRDERIGPYGEDRPQEPYGHHDDLGAEADWIMETGLTHGSRRVTSTRR